MSTDIQELLPFYVNGTLSVEEKALVEKALDDDPSLKTEIEFLEKLRDQVKGQEVEYSPGEMGLKRLQKSIAAEQLQSDPIALAQSKITKEQNWGWRAVAVAACLLLMLQSVLTFTMTPGTDLTAAGGKTIVQSSGYLIKVTFAPSAQEESIRNLLLSLDARIVDGPSALGAYVIAVQKDPAYALEKLRAHKNLIETADEDTGMKAGQP